MAGCRVLGRYTRTDDAEILKQAYDYHVHKLLSQVPDIRPDDIKLLLEEAALTSAKAKGANPQDFIDEGPIREIVRSGFVEPLIATSMMTASWSLMFPPNIHQRLRRRSPRTCPGFELVFGGR